MPEDNEDVHVAPGRMGLRRPSLYEFAGGEQAFLALAAAVTERCIADPELNHAQDRHLRIFHGVEDLEQLFPRRKRALHHPGSNRDR